MFWAGLKGRAISSNDWNIGATDWPGDFRTGAGAEAFAEDRVVVTARRLDQPGRVPSRPLSCRHSGVRTTRPPHQI